MIGKYTAKSLKHQFYIREFLSQNKIKYKR